MSSDDAAMKQMLRATAPATFAAYCESIISPQQQSAAPVGMDARTFRSLQHLHGEELASWASAEQVRVYFADKGRVDAYVKHLSRLMMDHGEACSGYKPENTADSLTLVLSSCVACSTPYDAGMCAHPSQYPKSRVPESSDIARRLGPRQHRLTLALGLLLDVLTLDDDELLAPARSLILDALAREAPCGVDMVSWHPLPILVGLIDNCTVLLPKAAHLAVACLALCVARRPAQSLSVLDPYVLAQCLGEYLEAISRRVFNADCIVEEAFGVVELLNALPLLYFLGEWRQSRAAVEQPNLAAALAVFAVQLCHSAVCSDFEDDKPADLENLPELARAKCYTRHLLLLSDDDESSDESCSSLSLHERMPVSFACCACLEVLGRWQHRGIRVAAAVFDRQSVAGMLAEYSDGNPGHGGWFQQVAARDDRFAFIVPLLKKLTDVRCPKVPRGLKGLLRGPLLHASQCCALGSCQRTTAATTDADGNNSSSNNNNNSKPQILLLQQCGGNCDGLARYCSSAHQKAHWAQHKHFCKREAALR